MKYIRLFEKYRESYLEGKDLLFITDVLDYLGVDDPGMFVEDYAPKSAYDVDIIDFLKEIFLGKKVIFDPIDQSAEMRSIAVHAKKHISGKVKDVGYYAYKDNLYIQIKVEDIESAEEEWYFIDSNYLMYIYDYDANTKPLHKEVEMKKNAEKYNL